MTDRQAATDGLEQTSPPLFDDRASAEAQPVMPIPKSRMTLLRERIGGVLNNGWRSFALVVILGLATGALAGMALVRATTAEAQPAATGENSGSSEDTAQLQNADVGAQGITADEPRVVRQSRPRIRHASGRPRAYRVAVLY